MKKVIEVKDLSKHFQVHQKKQGLENSVKALFSREYKEVKAVKDISFEVNRGELIGFIGANGAGKTTTLKMLSGLLYPTSGKVSVLGFTPNDRKNDFLKQISLVMGQKNQLFWDLPPIETFEFNRKVYDVSEKQYKRVLNELVDLFDVGEIVNQQVRKLSLGQRMKCELISSLIHTPKVLFLDEPTIGLDVSTQKSLRKIIKEYNKKYGSTILLTSHYMRDVQELCKRIIIIDHGTIIYDGNLSEIIKKYTATKRISIYLIDKAPKRSFLKFGKVVEYEDHNVVIEVKRKDVPQVASKILQELSVEDIDILETPIEDVIDQVFVEANNNHKNENR
ncbi:ATP-binding cassette domain-containing protein [Candidatus Microgenomates bacterium]|nr:MAG: ATP-binding cassette domain-containing protein [Candidatus Microgenomates bacterium]